MNDNVTTLAGYGSVDNDPVNIARQALDRAIRNRRDGSSHAILIAHVEKGPGGFSVYDVFWSEMPRESMLWLAKKIEGEALDWEDE